MTRSKLIKDESLREKKGKEKKGNKATPNTTTDEKEEWFMYSASKHQSIRVSERGHANS